jgi:hypothetical protein
LITTDDVSANNTITTDEARDLLIWMNSNWENLTGVSMRTVKDLVAAMKNHPTDYIDRWEDAFLIK